GRRRRGVFRRLGGSRRWPHRRHDHGLPAVRAGHGHRRRARQHRAERGVGDRDREFPALCARRARRSQRPPRGRLRAGGTALRQRRVPYPARSNPADIMPIMGVQMSLTMGYAILNAAGLSFIGLGVRPPTAEWGIMVAEGAAFMVSGEWWIAFFPGAALMVALFCFNLLGDG